MNFKDLTFLIHGGGLSDKTYGVTMVRPTQGLISSIRKYFPESVLMISTWDSEPYKKYNQHVDQIIIGPDPGVTWASKELNTQSSINRHIISSKNGLGIVTTKYVVLIRPDVIFKNAKLKSFLTKHFSNKKNKSKIIALAGGTLDEYSRIRKPFAFHINDFLYIGRTEKIKSLFDIANEIDSFYPNMYFEKHIKPIFQDERYNDSYIQRWIPESFVIKQFAVRLGYVIPSSSYDFSEKYKLASQQLIKDHFYLIDRTTIGIRWLKNNNSWQLGLSGILGRYTHFLYLSRQVNFLPLKLIYRLFHHIKIMQKIIFFLTRGSYIKLIRFVVAALKKLGVC